MQENEKRPISAGLLGLAAKPPIYRSPIEQVQDKAEDVQSVGGKIWTIQDDEFSIQEGEEIIDINDEDEKILLEREFDDFYEDKVHRTAGPSIFLGKCIGMIPVIWTDVDEQNPGGGGECKSYYNLYTLVLSMGKFHRSVASEASDASGASINSQIAEQKLPIGSTLFL